MPRSFRTASLAALAWLAWAPPLAAKPPAPDASDPREIYRDRGISICVAEMATVPDIGPDGLEAMCGCALDRFMARGPTGAPPPLGPDRLGAVMAGELMSCAAGRDSALAAAVARRLAGPAMRAPAAAPAPPPPIGAPDKRHAGGGPRFDPADWFSGFTAPRWLAALPLWAWAPLALLFFALVRGLLRRRDGRGDLIGPPRAMRPGTRLGPPPR
jgi:hypothetical protein